jgi:lysozyme
MMQTRSPENIPIIDVSRHQGTIDWVAVAASGVKGVMIKATEGIGYIDPLFIQNVLGAHAAGLEVGFYHFARPETPNTAMQEAEYFLAKVADIPATLPYALDVEGEAADLGPSRLTDWCHEWLETVEQRTGHRCMVYSGASFARSYLGGKLARWPLWIAHYGVNQPMANGTWERWAMHQYSETGRVDGIAGKVDLNEMDTEYWRELTTPPAEETEAGDMAKLPEGIANNIIDSYLSKMWFTAEEERKLAEQEGRKGDAASWLQLRDWQNALANELRKASGQVTQ